VQLSEDSVVLQRTSTWPSG